MYTLRIAVAITVLLIGQTTATYAGKRDVRPVKKKKEARIRRISGNFVGFITGGVYLADTYSQDSFSHRIIYGGGISLDVYPRPSWAFGVTAEGVLKVSGNQSYSDVGGFLWSGSFTYNFTTLRRTIPFAKEAVGYATIRGGNYEFLRLGLGLFRYTASVTNTRFEVYYCTGKTYGSYVGLQLGIGIPL